MSVASEINRIKANIAAAYTEAEAKGATMPATENSANLAQTVASIPEAVQPTLITKQITENGTYTAEDDNADGYSQVTVEVVASSKHIVDMKHDFHDRSSDIPNTYLDTEGEEKPYNGWKATDYIQIPDYPITVNFKVGLLSDLQYSFIYDEHKNVLRRLSNINTITNTFQNIIEFAKTNYNAKYVRFSATNLVIDSLSVYPIYTETECDVPQIISDPTNLSYFNISINSLIDIINALSDRTGLSSNILTVGSLNLSKLTAEQKAIATNKNWTLA